MKVTDKDERRIILEMTEFEAIALYKLLYRQEREGSIVQGYLSDMLPDDIADKAKVHL